MAAMLWWFPRWLADKSLPLLGAMLVQKKRKLHCTRWKVKYLAFPGKRARGPLECSPTWNFDLGRDPFVTDSLVGLKLTQVK